MTASEVVPLITERPFASEEIPALKALLVECLPLSAHLAGVLEAYAWSPTEIANRSIGFWAGDQLVAVVLKGQVLRAASQDCAADLKVGRAIASKISSLISADTRAIMAPIEVVERVRTRRISGRFHSLTGWEGLSQEGDAHQAVRPARRHEIQAFCEASFAAFREELGHDPSAHPQDPSYRAGWERALDAGQILGVWDNQGECVYRVELRPVLDRVTELRGVWLHPNLRGLGVARTFLAETTAFVGEHFDSKVVVFARDGNDAAQGLYRSAGFVPRGRLGRLDLANLGPGLL